MDIRTISKELQANKRALEPKVRAISSLIHSTSSLLPLSPPPLSSLSSDRRGPWHRKRRMSSPWRVHSVHSELNWAQSYSHNSALQSRQRYIQYIHMQTRHTESDSYVFC